MTADTEARSPKFSATVTARTIGSPPSPPNVIALSVICSSASEVVHRSVHPGLFSAGMLKSAAMALDVPSASTTHAP